MILKPSLGKKSAKIVLTVVVPIGFYSFLSICKRLDKLISFTRNNLLNDTHIIWDLGGFLIKNVTENCENKNGEPDRRPGLFYYY